MMTDINTKEEITSSDIVLEDEYVDLEENIVTPKEEEGEDEEDGNNKILEVDGGGTTSFNSEDAVGSPEFYTVNDTVGMALKDTDAIYNKYATKEDIPKQLSIHSKPSNETSDTSEHHPHDEDDDNEANVPGNPFVSPTSDETTFVKGNGKKDTAMKEEALQKDPTEGTTHEDHLVESTTTIAVPWLFRMNIFWLFVLSFAFYYLSITIFALLIHWIGKHQTSCIRVNGYPYNTFNNDLVVDLETQKKYQNVYSDAYDLSWTTFTSVGYGSVYPSTNNELVSDKNCSGITLVLTLESFFGLIFQTVVCGGILFGKFLYWKKQTTHCRFLKRMIRAINDDNTNTYINMIHIIVGMVLSMTILWYILGLIFALFLRWTLNMEESCIQGNGEDYTHGLYDPYQLSWQTLSTVGYGLVAPSTTATGSTVPCRGITFLLSFEGFISMWYTALCFALVALQIVNQY